MGYLYLLYFQQLYTSAWENNRDVVVVAAYA